MKTKEEWHARCHVDGDARKDKRARRTMVRAARMVIERKCLNDGHVIVGKCSSQLIYDAVRERTMCRLTCWLAPKGAA